MASRNLQAEVIDLVADKCGLAREKVQLSDRLLEDLGMHGDDAEDFFKSVHDRFGTDLTHLHQHWSEHFGPEGASCGNGFVILPTALVGGLVAGAGGPAFWGVAVTVALFAIWLWRRRPPNRMAPVRVGQVLAAVEAGAWPSSQA
jgi:hypothetical protein